MSAIITLLQVSIIYNIISNVSNYNIVLYEFDVKYIAYNILYKNKSTLHILSSVYLSNKCHREVDSLSTTLSHHCEMGGFMLIVHAYQCYK